MPYQMMVRCSNSVGLIWSRYHTTTDSIGRKCRWGCQVEIPHFHAVSSNGILIYKSPKTTASGTGNPRRVTSTRVFCFSDLEIGLIWSRFDSTLHKGDHIFCLCEEALTDSNCQFY